MSDRLDEIKDMFTAYQYDFSNCDEQWHAIQYLIQQAEENEKLRAKVEELSRKKYVSGKQIMREFGADKTL